VLLTGEPGLGKTQFGRWLAWRRQKPFFERLAPVKPESLPPYGVLLLDEVHRQSDVESLFPVMDKGVLTVIAATTKPDKLDSAFRSRFLLA
jgi:replication-associated recombination protein RarA